MKTKTSDPFIRGQQTGLSPVFPKQTKAYEKNSSNYSKWNVNTAIPFHDEVQTGRKNNYSKYADYTG
jgi:hypothetical protein